MKNLLIILSLISLNASAQLPVSTTQPNTTIWEYVQDTGQVKKYGSTAFRPNGTANALRVINQNQLWALCVSCIVDNKTILKGYSYRKWKLIPDTAAKTYIDAGTFISISGDGSPGNHYIINGIAHDTIPGDGNNYPDSLVVRGINITVGRQGLTPLTSPFDTSSTGIATNAHVSDVYNLLVNKNLGSQYRILVPSNQGLKTLAAGNGILIDSITTNVLTFKGDTGVLSTLANVIKYYDILNAKRITLSNDVTTAAMDNGTYAATLATVNSSPGTYGDATHIAQVTVDAKGRSTTVGNVAITFPVTTRDRLGFVTEDVTFNETRAVNGNNNPFSITALSKLTLSAQTGTNTVQLYEAKDTALISVYAGLNTSTIQLSSTNQLSTVWSGTATSTFLQQKDLARLSVFSGAVTSTISITKDSITLDASTYKIKNLARNNSGSLKMQVYDTAAKIIYYQDIPTLSGGADVYTVQSGSSFNTTNGNLTLHRNDGNDVVVNLDNRYTMFNSFSATSPILYDAGTGVISHANSGVTAGSYNNFTVNATGHITAASTVSYLTSESNDVHNQMSLQSSSNFNIGGTGKADIFHANQQVEFSDGFGGTGIIHAANPLTGTRVLNFPNITGTIAMDVNGNFADANGHISVSIPGDTNWFNTDMTLGGDRNHNGNNHSFIASQFSSIYFYSGGNTGDPAFSVFASVGEKSFMFSQKNGSSDIAYVGTNTSSGGPPIVDIHLDGTDAAGSINIDPKVGNLRVFNIPTYADNTAAASLATGTVYKTSTGVLMIKY